MKKRISKLLLFTLIMFTCVIPKPVHAGIIDTLQGWKDTVDTVTVIVGGGENASQLVNKMSYAAAESAMITVCPQCVETLPGKELPVSMRQGLVGLVDSGLEDMFINQPKVDILAHLANEWVPGYSSTKGTVYAAGFQDLTTSGIDSLWSATRNIAYVGYVVIMIIIGFMIMFRNKIGGQLMVTLGNSIPKVILSLVLVTFSFAIMGLIIDIGGVAKNVVTSIYYEKNVENAVSIHSPFVMFWDFFTKQNLGGGVGFSLITVIGGILTGFGAAAATGGTGLLVGGLALLLIGLVVIGLVLWGGIKLWITLLKAYLGLLVNVVVSPLAIMIGALPGNSGTMMNTFKSALRNVLVFPLAFAIVNLPYYLETLKDDVNLGFPETLTGIPNEGAQTGAFLLAIAKIAAIFAASSAPAMLNSVIPPTTPKSGGADAVKASLQGIPLIGGVFK